MSHLSKKRKNTKNNCNNQSKKSNCYNRNRICEAKPKHDYRGHVHGGLREGNEDSETKGWTSQPFPPPDRGIQQLEDGICIREGQTFDLPVEE